MLIFNRRGFSWRFSFLAAALALGLLLFAATEILSAFGQVNLVSLLLFWGSATVASAGLLASAAGQGNPRTPLTTPKFLKWLMAAVAVITVVTALVAAASAPNNFDSMTYRLSRVMHWIQNQSVAHYPTNIIRQIELNPWAEFALMHLQILSRGDFFANFVQWFAMTGSVIGVTLIAMELGADQRAQIYAAVVAATIPMGILQASSTQNDYVVTFWLVCFVYFGLLLKREHSWLRATASGSSLGLAVLTKATAYIYALPFLIWFFLFTFRSDRRRALWSIPLVAMAVLSINAGHYARNYQAFGNLLSSDNRPYVNEDFDGVSAFSNLSRNVALHIGTRSGKVNSAMEAGIEGVFRSLRININDPKTTWTGTSFSVAYTSRHEDIAGNSLHFLLIALSIVLIAARRDMRKFHNVLPYLVSVSAAFLLFCLYLKWQPWHSRLHLPLFVLWSPIIALTLIGLSQQWFAKTVMIVLLVFSLPYLFTNQSRRLLGKDSVLLTSRLDQYFKNQPQSKQLYYDAAMLIASRGCSDVAVKLGGDEWEYPLWMLLQGMSGRQFRIEHIDVANPSATLTRHEFVPCAVLRTSGKMQPYVSFPLEPAPR